MTSQMEAESGAVPESASILSLVAEWMSAASSRFRVASELAFAEARLAALSVTLMVFMGMLSALLVLVSWALIVAGVVAAAVQSGIALWLTLTSLSLVHAFGAWMLWNGAVKLSHYLNFSATRQQFRHLQEVQSDMGTSETAR